MLAAVLANAYPSWQTAIACGLALYAGRHSPAPVKTFLLLVAINWRNAPLMFHARAMIRLPIRRLRLIANGLLHPVKNAGSRQLGLEGLELMLPAIGQSPFSTCVASSEFVSWADGNRMLHMSNSTYNEMADIARWWLLYEIAEPLIQHEGLLLGAIVDSRFFFIREIPFFSKYRLEARMLTYDNEQWIYTLFRFLLPVTKQARSNSSIKLTKDSSGQERVLAAMGFHKFCCKLPGNRRSLLPARILALAGHGVDGQNWALAKQLRKDKKSKAWLKEETVPETMQVFEERRAKTLEMVKALDDKKSWLRLDEYISTS